MGVTQEKVVFTATDQTKQVMQSMRGHLDSIRSAVFSVKGAVLGLAGAGGFGLLVKQQFDAIDSMAKLSTATKFSTESIAGYSLAANKAGLETEAFQQMLPKFNRLISEAATGNKQIAAVFEELGVKLTGAGNKLRDSDAIFRDTVENMSRLGSETDRARLAQKLFEEQGLKLLPLLSEGSAALDEGVRQATAYGTAISRVDAAQVEAANDAITEAKEALTGAARTAAVELAPTVTVIAKGITQWVRDSDGFKDSIRSAANFAVMLAGYIEDARVGFGIIGNWVGNITEGSAEALRQNIAETEAEIEKLQNRIEERAKGGRKMADVIWGTYESGDRKVLADLEEKLAGFKEHLGDATQREFSQQELMNSALERGEDRVRRLMEVEKARAAAKAEEMAAGGDSGDEVPGASSEQLERQLEQVQNFLATEEEKVAQSYIKRSEIIYASWEARLLTDQEFYAIAIKSAEETSKKLVEIEDLSLSKNAQLWKKGVSGKMAVLEDFFGRGAALMQSGNEKMFRIGQAFAISETVISTIQSAQDSFKAFAGIPIVGPIMGAAAAAAAVAAGIIRVQQISSQRPGGRNVPPNPNVAPPSPPPAPSLPDSGQETKARGNAVVQLHSEREIFSKRDVLQLMDTVTDLQSDGFNVRFEMKNPGGVN